MKPIKEIINQEMLQIHQTSDFKKPDNNVPFPKVNSVKMNKPKLIYNTKVQKLIDNGKIVFNYKPIFSAVINFKDGGKCTYYSFEMRTSISQIRFQDFQPVIDLEFGYFALIKMIEKQHLGKYTTAMIFATTKFSENGKLCRIYKNDSCEIINEPDFSLEKIKAWKPIREQFVKDGVMKCDVCIDYSQRKQVLIFCS